MIKIKFECWWTSTENINNRIISQFIPEEDLKTYEIVGSNPDFTIVLGRTEWDKIETPKNVIDDKIEKVLSFDEQKELKRKKNQLSNQVKKAEENIAKYEEQLKDLDQKISNLDYSDEIQSAKFLSDYDSIKKLLDIEMESWEKSTEQLFQIND